MVGAEAAELKSAGIAIVVPWAGGEAEKILGTIPQKGFLLDPFGGRQNIFFRCALYVYREGC